MLWIGRRLVARSFGAAALTTLWISFAFPGAARAFAIHSFSPADVTIGTRLVIKGDFSELVASGARPKVQGTRVDTPRTVKFQVLAMSRRTIIARVKDVPSSKNDPAAGKSWSLRVRAPVRFDAGVRDALLELVYRSGSELCLLPFQDAVGTRERVNVPGTVSDSNWSYRMPMELSDLLADLGTAERLRGLAARSGRTTL